MDKGTRVIPSGQGRTREWPKTQGTVVKSLPAGTVEVHWDGTSFGDEMEQSELTIVKEAPPKKDMRLPPVPSYAIQKMLGERYGGQLIPEDACYFWDGVYYPVVQLEHRPETREVRLGDGIWQSDSLMLYLFCD